MSAFSTVPILDYAKSQKAETRAEFINELREAIINIGFLYLSNPQVERSDVDSLVNDYVPKLFDLPQASKDKIGMVNSPHFLGYSKLGGEYTRGVRDEREQYDFGTPHQSRWKEGAPDYHDLWGPSQWPQESDLPGFKATFERYLAQVQTMSYSLVKFIGEALGLSEEAMMRFYDTDALMQHRAKIVKYPAPEEGVNSDQGVGPHYDAGFLTFLLQASPHRGLQVQNITGEWIDVPPIPGTFVVNIGKALEFVTQNLARATSHRVLSPEKGSTPRYSIPFFQNISLDVRLAEEIIVFPQEVLDLKKNRDPTATDSVNFTEFDREPSGRVNLIGRVKSHPDVGQRHYPKLFQELFPKGLPAHGSAY